MLLGGKQKCMVNQGHGKSGPGKSGDYCISNEGFNPQLLSDSLSIFDIEADNNVYLLGNPESLNGKDRSKEPLWSSRRSPKLAGLNSCLSHAWKRIVIIVSF